MENDRVGCSCWFCSVVYERGRNELAKTECEWIEWLIKFNLRKCKTYVWFVGSALFAVHGCDALDALTDLLFILLVDWFAILCRVSQCLFEHVDKGWAWSDPGAWWLSCLGQCSGLGLRKCSVDHTWSSLDALWSFAHLLGWRWLRWLILFYHHDWWT